MIEVFVAGVSLRAPGLPGWEASRGVLLGERSHEDAPIEVAPPAMLGSNERRRAGLVTRLALAVAGEAVAASGLTPASLHTVFGSSNGDGATIVAILDAIVSGDGQVSPTHFHNSVHNAPAGYWSIAMKSMQPATCLGCNDWTAPATLLKAAAEAQADRAPVLMCLYDAPLPPPLDALRPMSAPFGAGLVLTPERDTRSLARLSIQYDPDPPPAPVSPLWDASLERLAQGQKMALLLPVLRALAAGRPDLVSLAMLDGRLDIEISPCSTEPPSLH